MNDTMLAKIGLDRATIFNSKLEELLTVGSKIFFQTHFYPLIRMQGFAREIYLSFKGVQGEIPVLLNVWVSEIEGFVEIHCGGMEISNRNRFEKELLESKRIAQEALAANADLTSLKNELYQKQILLEAQNRKLKAMNEQSKELFKVIAHDLQEPLRKSVMFASRLLDGEVPDLLKNSVTKVVTFNIAVRQMLLTLQRYEELEIAHINHTTIQLQAIIDAAIRDLEINLERENIVVNCDINCPEFLADKGLLKNLFIELIRSAIKYRKPEAKLKINISAVVVAKNIFFESKGNYKYEDFVKITVVDDGLGFDTENNKVFKIIQRSEQLDLIGIGLAFCRRIVEKHMGTIIAKSVKGKGTGFTILLPLKIG